METSVEEGLRLGSGSAIWAALREEQEAVEREMKSLGQMAAEFEARSAELQAMNRTAAAAAAAAPESAAMRSITKEAREIQEILVSELDRLSNAQVRIATQRMQLLQSENEINRRAALQAIQPRLMQRSPSFGHIRGGRSSSSSPDKASRLTAAITEATTAPNELSLRSPERQSTGLSTSFAPISPTRPSTGLGLMKHSLLSPEKPSTGLSTSFGPISPAELSLGFEPMSPARLSTSSAGISPQHATCGSDLGSGLDARLQLLKFGLEAARERQHQAAFSEHPEVQVLHGAAGDASEIFCGLDRLCSIRELLDQLRLRLWQAQVQAEALHQGAARYEHFAGLDDGHRAATLFDFRGAPPPASRRARSLVFPPGRTCRGSFACSSRMDVRSQLWHCREEALQMEGYIRDRRQFLQERRLEAPRSWNRLRPGSPAATQGCPFCAA
eukprot:TRINITY_DN7766_c0_g1_i1.p1 TRINITY_DN7766_c0_g1~~TRINITY_DN7766_c0_g1_i1.p1  ORF type:complete len:443 (-),score=96.91 TRINITY_DN7766_c0_g1_i1:68-1396(-)